MGSPRSYRFESYRKRNQSAYAAMDESTDGCSRILQLILLVAAVAALTAVTSSLNNCEFLWFNYPNALILQTNETAFYENNLNVNGQTSVHFGLFRYQNPANPNQCLDYKDVTHKAILPDELPLTFLIARWSISISSVMSLCALCLLSIEICCCRFVCSRVLINIAFLAAFCGIPPAFLLYTQGACNVFSSTSYSCKLGQGAIQAFVALGLFLVSLILSCVTPKSVPVIRVIQEREQHMVHDPCCCCTGKSKEEIYQDNPELLLANLPQDHVKVMSKEGGTEYIFKHYFDDQAGGVTLQSQYNAASRRWLQCEQNYAEVLDRFKQECNDQPDNNLQDWRQVLAIPMQEVKDPEVARQIQVLQTLKHNSQQARRVTDRIQEDLEEHIKPIDEKLEEALREIWEQQTKEPQQEETLFFDSRKDELEASIPPENPSQEEKDPVLPAKIRKEADSADATCLRDDIHFKSALMVLDQSTKTEVQDNDKNGESRASWVASFFTANEDGPDKKLS